MVPLIVILVLLIPILAIVLDSDLGKAIARRLESGNRTRVDGGTHDRLVYLESELERLGREVGRLEEESRFFQKLLAENTEAGALPRPGGTGASVEDS
ncbi:MAG: hypothetical protein OXQ94_03590 [Gemmatimonadota bacterium]|nr:hypothetical protein [Gemmatimonadota bacterium]MDE2870762.1 hypothetical protein [Gemmatimonadota bacterium]